MPRQRRSSQRGRTDDTQQQLAGAGWFAADRLMNAVDRRLFYALSDPKGCVRAAGCAVVGFPFAIFGLAASIVVVSMAISGLDALGLPAMATGLEAHAVEVAVALAITLGFAVFLLMRRGYRSLVGRRRS